MALLLTAPAVGAIGPMPDGLDEPFWEGLEQGVLRVQQCPDCGRWVWSPLWACDACGREHPVWTSIQPVGMVFSWIRTWHPFAPELRDIVPYLTALIELPEAGNVRMMGIVLGEQLDDPVIGERVVGEVQPPSEATSGYPVMRWRRLPA